MYLFQSPPVANTEWDWLALVFQIFRLQGALTPNPWGRAANTDW